MLRILQLWVCYEGVFICIIIVIIVLLLLTGPLDPPTDLRETDNMVIGSENCSHEIRWNVSGTRGLKEYRLISSVMERPIRVHPEKPVAIYNKRLEDTVTLAVVAINQCGEASDMSNTLILCKLRIYCM